MSEKHPEFKEIADSLNVKEIDVEEMGLRLSNRDVSPERLSETMRRIPLTWTF